MQSLVVPLCIIDSGSETLEQVVCALFVHVQAITSGRIFHSPEIVAVVLPGEIYGTVPFSALS
jgi:hypothetical protein